MLLIARYERKRREYSGVRYWRTVQAGYWNRDIRQNTEYLSPQTQRDVRLF